MAISIVVPAGPVAEVEAASKERSYVVMSRSLKTIRTVAGDDALQDVIAGKEMKKAGVGVAKLNSMEVSRLKSRDVIVEPNIKFKAMSKSANLLYSSVQEGTESEEEIRR